MRIFDGTGKFRADSRRPLVLALGNFDGIHRGHRQLLDYVVSQAKILKGRAAVFTFRNHPQQVLHPAHVPENLQTLNQKLALFKECGIQDCFLQRFDRRFAAFSAEEFVKKILVKRLRVREICLGYNARFGRGRAGDADLLRELGHKFNFQVCQMKPVLQKGLPVSSTAVREAVHQGNMELAAAFLGRPWSIAGKVVRGSARGRRLGFPTANLKTEVYVRPARGVYAVWVRTAAGARKRNLRGVLNYGVRPTFGKAEEAVFETHILDFKGQLYGKKIEIFFLKHLRKEKIFASVEALRQQIKKDIQSAKTVFRTKKWSVI